MRRFDPPGLTFVVQEPQLGTAHALLTTEPALQARGTPCAVVRRRAAVVAKTLKTLVDGHESAGAAATVGITAMVEQPEGYGARLSALAADCSHRRASRRQRG